MLGLTYVERMFLAALLQMPYHATLKTIGMGSSNKSQPRWTCSATTSQTTARRMNNSYPAGLLPSKPSGKSADCWRNLASGEGCKDRSPNIFECNSYITRYRHMHHPPRGFLPNRSRDSSYRLQQELSHTRRAVSTSVISQTRSPPRRRSHHFCPV